MWGVCVCGGGGVGGAIVVWYVFVVVVVGLLSFHDFILFVVVLLLLLLLLLLISFLKTAIIPYLLHANTSSLKQTKTYKEKGDKKMTCRTLLIQNIHRMSKRNLITQSV